MACRRAISFFEHQELPTTPSAPAGALRAGAHPYYDKLGRTQIRPEKAGNTRYKDRRLLALYFDLTAMPPSDQIRALAAAEKFVRTQMTPADLVAILRYSGGAVDVLQDFTGDHDRLLSILQTMIVGEDKASMNPPATTPLPTPGPPSARTTPSSTSSTPTASCPPFRRPRRCWAGLAKRKRSFTSPAACG